MFIFKYLGGRKPKEGFGESGGSGGFDGGFGGGFGDGGFKGGDDSNKGNSS